MAHMKSASAATKPSREARPKALPGMVISDKEARRPQNATPLQIKLSAVTLRSLSGLERDVQGLMKVLGDGVCESRRSGRDVSVVVQIDPTGRLRIGADETQSSEQAQNLDDGGLEQALTAARARGRLKAIEILSGEDMLNGEAFAALLGVSRATVNTKRQHQEVLALEGAKRGYRFPAWQVDQNGKPFAVIPALFECLGAGAWTVYRFLVQHHPELDGMTALEALRRGRDVEVIETAEGIAGGTFA